MERKIGEGFMDGEDSLKVFEGEGCNGCLYNTNHIFCNKDIKVAGLCAPGLRKDKQRVIFKIVK